MRAIWPKGRRCMCEVCRRESPTDQAQPSRRGLLRLLGAAAAGLALPGSAGAKEDKKPPKPQNVVSPNASLELLVKGNKRYVDRIARRDDFKNVRKPLVAGHNPYPPVPSCATYPIS